MKQRDYYSILEVARDADGDTIKKNYRKLAFRFHPDRNPGDKEAEQEFRKATEAYEVLRDPEKRKQYDNSNPMEHIFNDFDTFFRGTHQEPPFSRYRTPPSSDIPIEEILNNILGGRGADNLNTGINNLLKEIFNQMNGSFSGVKGTIIIKKRVFTEEDIRSGNVDSGKEYNIPPNPFDLLQEILNNRIHNSSNPFDFSEEDREAKETIINKKFDAYHGLKIDIAQKYDSMLKFSLTDGENVYAVGKGDEPYFTDNVMHLGNFLGKIMLPKKYDIMFGVTASEGRIMGEIGHVGCIEAENSNIDILLRNKMGFGIKHSDCVCSVNGFRKSGEKYVPKWSFGSSGLLDINAKDSTVIIDYKK